MFEYCPEQIIIDAAVQKEPLAHEICQRFSEVPVKIADNDAWKHSYFAKHDPVRNPLTKGKKILHLKRFQGAAVKLCPGFDPTLVCCNYMTLDLIENCPFECSYCILQAFLNKSVITVHANLEEIFSQIEAQSMKTGQKFRIGTGEHSDSLALDPWTGINRHLIPFIAKLPNAVLELKTKSSFVEQLLDLPHGGKTVISWSINPANFVNREEHKTAKLEARLKAARLASDAGYKVAFHFDPLIYQPNWKQEYQRLAEQLFDSVSPDRISWISFGTLRYLPALKTIAEERFPQSRVFLGEFIQGEDGKYRYMKRLRRELLQGVREIVHKRAPTVPTYYCMEKTSIWEDSLVPASPERMEEHIIQKVSA